MKFSYRAQGSLGVALAMALAVPLAIVPSVLDSTPASASASTGVSTTASATTGVSTSTGSNNWKAPVRHDASAFEDCADVAVVGVRGSGQTADQNEGFGREVAAVRDAIRDAIGDDRRVRQVQIDYDSAPVNDALFLNVDLTAGEISNRYIDSIGSGIQDLEPVIDDSIERCPNEKVVLVGYSQGALVVHSVAALYPDPEKFGGIVLVADPGRNGEDVGTLLGTAPAGNGLTGWAGDVSSFPLDDVATVVTSVCNADDLVCDTENLMMRVAAAKATDQPGPTISDGMDVHTGYVNTSLLSEAGRVVADRLLSFAVPADTMFDVPIGADVGVSATVERMRSGTTATWRLDPSYTNPAGVTIDSNGKIAARFTQQGTVNLKAQVRGSIGDWRDEFIILRVGAGEYCPDVDDLMDLTATPRTLDDIFVDGSSADEARRLDEAQTFSSLGTAAPLAAPAPTSGAAAESGVIANTVVSRKDSARRAPSPSLDGQRLSSPDGLLVWSSAGDKSVLLAFETGQQDPIRDLRESSPWSPSNPSAATPTWLRGSLITAPSTDDAGGPSVVWENLTGTIGGEASVVGDLLTGSSNGWYESYRWPSRFGCASDGSFMVREVDVLGAEPVRHNVAAVPPATMGGAIPMLAESDGDRSLALLVGVLGDQEYTDARVLLWTKGSRGFRNLGSVVAEDAPGLSVQRAWLRDAWSHEYQSIDGSQMSVNGSAVSVQLARPDRDTSEAWEMDWPGNGVKNGIVYRFAVGETTRRWDAKWNSELVTLPTATVFTGPDFQAPVIGHADGSTAESALGARGNDELATDGTSIIMTPGPNGPLSHPWVGSDDFLEGFLYRYADPAIDDPERIHRLPVVGNVGSVFGVALSDDSLTWTDDSVDVGAQWMTRVDTAAPGATVTGGIIQMGDMVARMQDSYQSPWVEGEWNLRVRDDSLFHTSLVAFRNGIETWSTEISNEKQSYSIHDGLVVISSGCAVLKLATGQPAIAQAVRTKLGLDGQGCLYIAVDGDRVVWVDQHSGLWTSSLTAGTAKKLSLGTIDGRVRHLSIADGRMLLVTEGSTVTGGDERTKALTTDVSDLTKLSAPVHLTAVESAIRSAEGDEGALVDISRSGSTFALSLGANWTYDYAEHTEYGGYRDASILVFGFRSAEPLAWIKPPASQNYMFGPVVSLNGTLLAWSDGIGGVVLSRLDLTEEGGPDPTPTPTPEPTATPTPTHTPTPTAPTVDRVQAADRYGVAVAVSKVAYPSGAPVVYVATGTNYPDALSAGPAAVRDGGPLLLTTTDSLPTTVRDEIVRLKPGKIVVVGGPNSVSEAVLTELKHIQPSTVRISGADRYEASRNLVDYAFGETGAASVYVATGANFPDALSAGAAGGSREMPVLLVNGGASSVDKPTEELLKSLKTTSVLVAGGPNSVSPAVYTALDAAVSKVARLSGADRFEASVAINHEAFAHADRVFLATGLNFPDALAGSAWAGATSAPLFVVPTDCVPAGVRDQITKLGASTVTLLGGPNSLTNNVARLVTCG